MTIQVTPFANNAPVTIRGGAISAYGEEFTNPTRATVCSPTNAKIVSTIWVPVQLGNGIIVLIHHSDLVRGK